MRGKLGMILILLAGLFFLGVSCGAVQGDEPLPIGDTMASDVVSNQITTPDQAPLAELLEGLEELEYRIVDISEIPGLEEAFNSPNTEFVKNYNTGNYREEKYIYNVDITDAGSYIHLSRFENGYILRVVVFDGHVYSCASPTAVTAQELVCIKIIRPQTGFVMMWHSYIILREDIVEIVRFNNAQE